MWRAVRLLAGMLACASACLGGVNEGGVLIVHVNESLEYSSGQDYCGQAGLGACLEGDTRWDGSEVCVFHVLAAFPDTSAPDVAVIYFGMSYGDSVAVVARGSCADEEIPDPDWPASSTGTAVAWRSPYHHERLFEVYWFAAYAEGAGPAVLSLGPHPELGGWFIDSSEIGDYDPITDYGRLGFGTEGYLPCPGPTPVDRESWGGVKVRFR